MTVHNVDGLQLRVDRGPNWLFVKVQPRGKTSGDVPAGMADELWSISSRHFIYRIVLELDELRSLPKGLMNQLATLQERLAECGGALRLCGLSPEGEKTLHDCHLDAALPNHATRADAVFCSEAAATTH